MLDCSHARFLLNTMGQVTKPAFSEAACSDEPDWTLTVAEKIMVLIDFAIGT